MRMSRVFLFALAVLSLSILLAVPADVSFTKAAAQVARFDFVEISATVPAPDATNPFENASLSGSLETADSSHHWAVDGFCDSTDGALFRIRFMAPLAGDYKYSVTYKQGSYTKSSTGRFRAVEAQKRGLIAVDPQYPWHFIWQGTGEHYFFNGATAYWLVGFRDDHTIQYSLDRLHRLKVNRLRVTIAGREASTFFGEPVMIGPAWTPLIAAWPAQSADDPLHPGFDYHRFNLPYWQKFDRMLQFARDRDMNISVVLDMGDSKVHPVAGGEDEHRFIRYAVNRFAAFSNITWDLGDDLDGYRDEKWTHETGMLIQDLDPTSTLKPAIPPSVTIIRIGRQAGSASLPIRSGRANSTN
jgi:Domain of unknown function (DUF5060)/Protein of unknown function (DUF4038)